VDGVLTTGPAETSGPSSEGQCPFEGTRFSLSNDTGHFHTIDPVELAQARAIDSRVLSFSTGYFLEVQGYSVNSTFSPFPQQPDCNDLWSPPPAVLSLLDSIIKDFSGEKPFAALHWRRYNRFSPPDEGPPF